MMDGDNRATFVKPRTKTSGRVILYPFRLFARIVFFLVRPCSMILIIVAAMALLNIATLTTTGFAAAAGSLLARAGLTTVANTNANKLAKAEAEIVEQSEKVVKANQTIAQKDRSLTLARDRIERQSKELENAKQTIDQRERSLSTANDKNKNLSKKITDLESVRYRGSKSSVKGAVSDFANRVSRRTATATARNLTAIPAEAIPLFGIAVIVGATAWELKDACGLMQDVHELNIAFDPTLANDPEHLEACGLEVPTRAEVWSRVVKDPGGAVAEQPNDYLDIPNFETPAWWDWLISRSVPHAAIKGSEITP